ncbi:MAG: cation transporter [Erysipelotrichaceae bacterium]|nr:cation transporter [Erysipelotrichaceae bacterium]MCI9524067.1 cation transporter [Erysipelotrichaceae bacterium]
MMKFLIAHRIQDYENVQDEAVREAYGSILSFVGILTNLFLFVFKFLAGTLSGSVSITADAINNLSDAGSSVISWISFKLSNRPADEEHPFGHARYEYIASLVVAFFILFLGIELIKSSFDKIVHPEAVSFSYLSAIILAVSIAAKFWMFSYNRKYGKLLNSTVMEATAADSISDCMATGAVLLSTCLSPLIHFNLDGYMGVVVALFIIVAGGKIVKETLDMLLGKSPDKDEVKAIIDFIKAYDGVLGIHDLMIHDYGPGKRFGSVHVEVDAHEDIFTSHDMIDNIEREMNQALQIQMVIHMDPIDLLDEETNEMRSEMKMIVQKIHPDLSIHDFRMVRGTTHTNLIFDCLVPHHVNMDNVEILAGINERLAYLNKTYYVVVTFDRAYTTDIKQS